MPTQLESYSNQRLEPAQYPEDARVDIGAFGANLTLARGTVLGRRESDGKLYAYSADNSDGTETAIAILMYDIKTDANGKVYLGDSAEPSIINRPFMGTTVFVAGTFDPDELTGWDDNALSDFGARELHNGFIRIP